MVTLKDVARDCGCSWTTVSRVLNNRTGHFSEETRQRIFASAAKLGYQMNHSARALRGLSTGRIGYIGGLPQNTALSVHLLRSLEKHTFQHGYRLLMGFNHGSSNREAAHLQALLAERIDGLIIGPTNDSVAPALRQMLEQQMPLVTIGSTLELSTPDVSIDREHGGYLMARHLLQLGRRRPAMIASGLPGSAASKLAGLQRGFAEAGIDLASCPRVDASSLETQEAPAFGAEAAGKLLQQDQPFDAVITLSDDVALGVVDALVLAGVPVPRQVAVIGFADEHFAPYARVPLTTIHTPREKLGSAAFDLLWRQLRGGGPRAVRKPDGTYERISLRPWLVERTSTRQDVELGATHDSIGPRATPRVNGGNDATS